MKKAKDFHFKNFTVKQDHSTHKVGTDAVLLGAWVDVTASKRILDIGAGTGVISLMLAQRTGEEVTVDAIEIQENEAKEANENFKRSPWRARLKVHHTSLQEYRPQVLYDLIVSNPPFFYNSYLPPRAERSLVRHGMELTFENIIEHSLRLLKAEGTIAIVLPPNEGSKFTLLANEKGLHCLRICEFKSRLHKPIERLLIEFSSRKAEQSKVEALVLYKEGEMWTDEYRALMRDFYLKA
jgi:tRNA1Val (adenine37-N6)-methyltransferase